MASKRIGKKPTGEDFDAISISIGVAESRNGELLSELTQRSDKGLYQAKDSRRRAKILLKVDAWADKLDARTLFQV